MIVEINGIEYDLKYLKIDARVRFWEDAEVNGSRDTSTGDNIPCKESESWKPIIDVENGKIMNWTEGIEAKVFYKVCDDADYKLLTENKKEIQSYTSSYVPPFLDIDAKGYGDYIRLTISEEGYISNWNMPKKIDFTR